MHYRIVRQVRCSKRSADRARRLLVEIADKEMKGRTGTVVQFGLDGGTRVDCHEKRLVVRGSNCYTVSQAVRFIKSMAKVA